MGRPRKIPVEVIQQKQVSVDGMQNCFARFSVNPKLEKVRQKQSEKYFELQERKQPNGFTYELVEVDYPITKASVKSYEESTRYTRDVDSNPKRAGSQKNLGDVSQMQELLQSDGKEAYEAFKQFMQGYAKKTAELKQKKETKTEVAE